MSAATTHDLTAEEAEQFAGALLNAFEAGEPLEPITAARPGLAVEGAYRIQRALIAGHARAGRTVVGRKIGLTSLAMQRQLGIDSPDFGALLDSHVFPSGATLSRSRLRMVAPKLEAEVAFVLDRELRGGGVGAEDVLRCTRAVLPVFELIDSRIRDWRITLADTVADNASCLGAVLGTEVALADAGDLRELAVRFGRDGEVLQEGTGAAVMGDPAVAVAWLANELARFGEALPAGQPVLAGSFTAAIEATPGRYEASFGERLGSITVDIVE
ncbi:MAG: 2-keto-4-pentenoate hydratase [Actinobacteria bacterium]|nr:MAG: 2-keto-4-pentenoate hydratase [Actinomycetota bacterium]